METQVTIELLNCIITVNLPDAEDDNTVLVEIHRKKGTFDSASYNSFLKNFQFSAESLDPNKWVLEALDAAIATISSYGILYAPLPTGIYEYQLIPNYRDFDFGFTLGVTGITSNENETQQTIDEDADIPF